LRIGRGHDNDLWFKGALDEVAIFNRTLSEREDKQIYDAQK
jgi:hypothetical protein